MLSLIPFSHEPYPPPDPQTPLLNLDESQPPPQNNTSQTLQKCLVGKLYSNKTSNPFAIMDVMKKAWRSKKGVDAREWSNNLLLFRFEDEAEMKWVLKNQPWHFEGNIFLIRHLEAQEQPSKIHLFEAHIWTRFYDAPLSCMNPSMKEALASSLGNFICSDPLLDVFGKYIRVKIGIDITKPLKRGIYVMVGGEKLWLHIKYESLPTFCFNCGHDGHTFKRCELVDHLDELDPLQLPFEPDIKASTLKKQQFGWTRGDHNFSPPFSYSKPNHVSPSAASSSNSNPTSPCSHKTSLSQDKVPYQHLPQPCNLHINVEALHIDNTLVLQIANPLTNDTTPTTQKIFDQPMSTPITEETLFNQSYLILDENRPDNLSRSKPVTYKPWKKLARERAASGSSIPCLSNP